VKRVLVTGASSVLGERIVRRLLEETSVESVLAVGPDPQETALPFTHPSHLRYLQVDLSKPRQIHRLLFGPAKDMGMNVILHSAYQHRASEGGRRLRALSVESTRELLALSERHPTLQHFVYRSFAEVYLIGADLPSLIEEDHPLNLAPGAPQWIRDRVEADLTVCAAMGLSPLRIAVLRCAECLAPGTGSQLYDFLESPICFRPLGFNPMVNVLSLDDCTRAVLLAVNGEAQGTFNIPGRDTLPLASAILKWNRMGIPLPNGLVKSLYRWRSRLTGHEFRYGMNQRRFHYSGVLDGRRAKHALAYVPEQGVDWPAPTIEKWGDAGF
jgi:UDP-glucose 4-epimerase